VSTMFGGISTAWSLCVEITFYLALPFFAAGLALLGRGATRRGAVQREIAALAAIAVGSIVVQHMTEDGTWPSVLLRSLPSYMDWFALGMILAVVSVAAHGREGDSPVLQRLGAHPWAAWLGAAIVYWFLTTRIGLPTNPYFLTAAQKLELHILFGVCAALLLLPAIFCDWAGGWPRRLLATPALAWLGLISYGLFLYHGRMTVKLHSLGADGWIPGSRFLSLLIIVGAVGIAAGAASYYLVERRILRFKDGWRPGTRVPSARAAVAATASAPALPQAAAGETADRV
jgi:peptidoglycan/LPS O-acetylase OafA/YrhL